MSKLQSIILAFRPKTLTAALVPCVAASAMAYALKHSVNMLALVYALLASFFIQIGTNLVNDAVDFKKGADTEKRIGPTRITQAGVLAPQTVLALAAAMFLLAILCGIPLVIQGGMAIVVIGLISVVMGYAYTAGPFPLAYLGLGDLFVIIFFGLVAVMGMSYLHLGQWQSEALILGLQIGFHATTLIAINNLRDIEGDSQVHKKTLAVRFGKKFVRQEIMLLSFIPFLLNIYWLGQGFYLAALLPFLALPLALKLTKNINQTEPSAIYNKFLGQAAGLHLIFGLLISIGFYFT